jgi:hypothetical protein
MDAGEVRAMIDAVLTGFSVALLPQNLMFCFIGCLIGTLVGVLPGLGPVAAISILTPTISNAARPSIITLPARLRPRTTTTRFSSTCLGGRLVITADGYQMARMRPERVQRHRFLHRGTVSVILLWSEPWRAWLASGHQNIALMTIGLVVTFLRQIHGEVFRGGLTFSKKA